MAVARYLKLVLAPPAWFSSIPAGHNLGKIGGGIAKAMGYHSGAPDLLLISAGIAHFCELKTKTGRLSPEQKLAHAALVAAGAKVAVVRSLDDLDQALREWDIPTKGKLLPTGGVIRDSAA